MHPKKEFSGYRLTEKLRKARRTVMLTATEQALFYELAAICNDSAWPVVFTCSNAELCHAIHISENTLVSARISLIDAGLIFYASGKSKREFGSYSFQQRLADTPDRKVRTASKFEPNVAVKSARTTSTIEVDVAPNVAPNAEVNVADYKQSKSKSKSKTTKSKDLVPRPPAPPSQKLASKGESKPEHWQPIVDAWFLFYEARFGISPTFEGPAPAALKKIISRLRVLSEKSAKEAWSEQYALRVFNHFLALAVADTWRADNFMLHILNSHFDGIIKTKINETGNRITAKNGGSLNADYKRELAAELE